MRLKSFSTLLLCLFSLFCVEAFGQAKKPRLVVVPSDALLNQMGLLGTTDDMGEVNYVQNYKTAFLDTDFKACIAKIAEMFTDRGFPLTMLEAELRRAQGKNIVIPVDIRLELNYKINKSGPREELYFELTALDAYSSKQIGATSGPSKPAIGESKVNLLQEAVLSHIDKFASDIDTYFTGLADVGHESRLTIESQGGVDLNDIIDDVEDWLSNNCVNGAFSTDNVDESSIQVSQAMMPLYGANGRALDARNFYSGLRKALEAKGLVVKQSSSAANSGSGGGTLGDAYLSIE